MMMKKEMLLKKQVEYNSFDDADIKNIIFGVDANYIKYAAVTMLSIIKHNQDENIAFHIFCDEIKEEDLQKIKHMTEENPQISIIIYYLSNGRLQVQIEQDLSSNYISGIHLIKKSVEQFIRSVVA